MRTETRFPGGGKFSQKSRHSSSQARRPISCCELLSFFSASLSPEIGGPMMVRFPHYCFDSTRGLLPPPSSEPVGNLSDLIPPCRPCVISEQTSSRSSSSCSLATATAEGLANRWAGTPSDASGFSSVKRLAGGKGEAFMPRCVPLLCRWVRCALVLS